MSCIWPLPRGALTSRKSSASLIALVRRHCFRIRQTVAYALAQDNNHGVTEAAALFVGGSWLELHGIPEGAAYRDIGRRLLIGRVMRLVDGEGGFSMYSISYHRETLDVLSMAEVWRRRHGLAEFPLQYRERARAMTCWLWEQLPMDSRLVPGIGAVDGSRLFYSEMLDHRDASDSLAFAFGLFGNDARVGDAYDAPSSAPLQNALGIPIGTSPERGTAKHFACSGFAILRNHRARATCIMRYPEFRFRPAQADALHVDLWVDGKNLLRDAGSYSYAASDSHGYFSGTEGHNTVQFDGRDQMPRLGRFLFGDWLKTSKVEPIAEDGIGVSFGAGYRDGCGASHFRRLKLAEGGLRVEDEVAGFKEHAVLRWRLTPDIEWILDGSVVAGGGHRLEVSADVPIRRIELVERLSRYYLQKSVLPVLEVEIDGPGRLVSEYRWEH